MWSVKPRLFILLAELVDLLREQNSLLREQIEVLNHHRPARTPMTRASLPALPRPTIRPINLSAADVTTPETRRRGPADPPLAVPTAREPEIDQDPTASR